MKIRYHCLVILCAVLFGPGAALSAQDDAAETLRLAHEAFKAFLQAGELAKALDEARIAYELAGEVYGAGDVSTARLGFNYATLLVSVGNYRNARPLLGHVTAIYEAAGDQAAELVPVLLLTGQLQSGNSQMGTVKRALELQKSVAPDDRSAYAKTILSAGRYLARRPGGRPEAIPMLTEALEILESIHGSESAELIPALMALGDASAEYQVPMRQKRFYDRALKIAETDLDPVARADLLSEAGMSLLQLSTVKTGIPYVKRAHKIYASELGAENPKTATAVLSLARYDLALGNDRTAEKKLVEALEIFEGQADLRNHRLKTLALLVESLERRGKRDEATRYCQAIGQLEPWTPDQEPVPLVRVAPRYPEKALRHGQQGTVIVEFSIDEDGIVSDAVVVDSENLHVFHEAAVDAVSKFRYAPRYVDGQPVTTAGLRQKMSFQINR